MIRCLRVLLVEDSNVTALMLTAMIQSVPDVEVEAVGTLEDALRQLQAGDVDAVVLDLGLPNTTGLEAFEQIRREYPAVPVVVVTGTDREEFEQRARAGGAEDYILKSTLAGPNRGLNLVRAMQAIFARLRE